MLWGPVRSGRLPAPPSRRVYDRIGRGYTITRRADPRIGAAIRRALGDAHSVLNVGAGAGAYEPSDRTVVAVEPSAEMVRQRPAGSAAAIRAVAEALPFRNGSFDAVLTVLSIHHWADPAAGLGELRRVARRHIVIFTLDPMAADNPAGYPVWLQEYIPELARLEGPRFPTLGELRKHLGALRIEEVPIPNDCMDGFGGAFWGRPEFYLDSAVRSGMSGFRFLDPSRVEAGIRRLANDLASGRWDGRFGHLRDRKESDLGYRLVIAGGG
jgi:SAM-dependent methyltransferase